MWITTSNEHLRRLKSEHTLGEVVEFNDSQTAQVRKDVGESAIDHYDTITKHK